MNKQSAATLACILLAGVTAQSAEETTSADGLDTVVVSATRLRSVKDVDVPASVTTVPLAQADSNRAQTSVTEALSGIPGVTALDRQNYAQDTQLSIRGFGARATFGVRGLRLYADGIPASMPDGQGQLSHFNLLGADHIQVLRGPFSALYGNSSGGVVQIWSRAGSADASARLRATYGSHDTRSLGAQALGELGIVDYNMALSRFETDGYRNHSAARRDSVNGRFGIDTGAGRKLSVVVNFVDIPEAQDALGLTPADWRIDPRQTASVATQFNTRKSVRQLQGGVVFEQQIADAHTLHVMAYNGNRKVRQYLAIPVGPQGNPLHSGGVVDLDNDYRGADLRWSWEGRLAGRPMELTVGGNFDLQNQLRRGYNNFVGTTLGVQGALRRDETDRVRNLDEFAQAWWQIASRWSVLTGLRHSTVRFRSTDRYIAGTNRDDSGRRRYADTTKVGGLMFHPLEGLRLYASVGDGFESPTFNEISYRADGQSGLALDLLAANSRALELGMKWRAAGGTSVDAALFRASTHHELAVARNVGGRSSFRNIDRTRRQGLELAVQFPLTAALQLESAYTLLDAKFRAGFLTCTAAPCVTANVPVLAGTPMPGIPRHQGTVRLRWSPHGWSTALEFTGSSRLIANDIGSEAAPGYGIWNAELGRSWAFTQGSLRGFARVENLFNRDYVGSVIVNEGNSRFFESGLDRTATVGMQWQWR